MKIAISGTPGTGKTSVAKILAKNLGYALIDLNGFAKAHGLILGKDKARNTAIVDVAALEHEMSAMEGDIILEGHLSHFCGADIFIILRANPKVLSRRLRAKGWRDEKILENIEAEIMNICLNEALERHDKKVFEIDTTKKSPAQAAKIIEEILGGKSREKYAPGRIDWAKYIGRR